MCLDSEEILSKPSFTPTAGQLPKLTRTHVPLAVSGEEDAMNRLNALLIASEFLGLIGFSFSRQLKGAWTGGGIDYNIAVNQRRLKTQAFTADALIRKRVHELLMERRQECTNLSAAIVCVLREHTDFWNEARLEFLNTPPSAPAAGTEGQD